MGQPPSGSSNVLGRVPKGTKGHVIFVARVSSDLLAQFRLIEAVQSAAGVVDQHDPLGAELSLGKHQRANHIIRGDSTGISNDVGLAEIQSKCAKEVEA